MLLSVHSDCESRFFNVRIESKREMKIATTPHTTIGRLIKNREERRELISISAMW